LDGPRSLYGMTKLASELMIEEFADAYNFRFIISRYGLITGPGQMAKSDQGVIALWVAAHHYRKDLSYIGFGGTGKQVRDFLHIDDVSELVLDQMRNFPMYAGRRWNAGGGLENSLSLLETTDLCQEITGQKIGMSSQPANRPADVRIYITDARCVQSVNGWRPKKDAAATVGEIHHWLIDGGDELRGILFGT